MLMRNGDAPPDVIARLGELRDRCATSTAEDHLRGLEGAAAAAYFEHFGSMVRGDLRAQFDWRGRNRRPPKDPLNALLSLGYSVLAKELAGIAQVVGLDPYLGFFHRPRYGRPALALDLMEEFRPLIADSVAVSLVNRGEVDDGDFVHTTRGVILGDRGRKAFWKAWSRRMEQEVTHPAFGYRMSYRRMMDVQVRQMWRYCRDEAARYHAFTTR
jgi:CRISPR-associated protein Cas1